jgi:hypothetical protein
MKRVMIGLAAAMIACAAWSQGLAEPSAAHVGPFQCTVGVTSIRTGKTHVLTAKLRTVEACKTWALDANHLDAASGSYELLVHDTEGRVVFHQACTVKGLPLFGSRNSAFECKDVAA